MKSQNDELMGYHVVFTTHNSRTSQRMIQHGIKKGNALLLNLPQEIILTKIIGDIIHINEYRCIAYNICKDHVHLLLVCGENELSNIVQKMKSISSKLFNKSEAISDSTREYHKGHLWSQKYYRATLDVWEWAGLSKKAGEVYPSDHLHNSITYIKTNRGKHNLEESEELEIIISKFIISVESAFELV